MAGMKKRMTTQNRQKGEKKGSKERSFSLTFDSTKLIERNVISSTRYLLIIDIVKERNYNWFIGCISDQ